ncbi:ribosome silencing factor [Alloprevotella tannerae]|jgi:iojap-like ribosome-associated protein|uniref:Ribosomal silencing factor RsfS n=1 Tax=Alloprevotella tannerae ATCC 51259 TaxID=626522 RepID=C9LE91_9BACT|nr:ribosome silencing factor [Alloprevotella tannerae]EEX72574.1 iojap-like protein [Alloprevotella tannerae ATCC 51259]MCG2647501.1 ribosome silencing factor [Alloprevotella tannerae]MCG2648981.1 ribosome silencing factor [Alloprevotella tannerae]MCG2651312.1 ribosome silencing factor [Alloprevotella tannerae]MCG2653365.1 ribosome silencing factor [Alloprevotella tannerae]
MNSTPEIVNTIVQGMQEKKAFDVTIVDLRKIDTAPAEYFVLCNAGSPQQVEAVAGSVSDETRKALNERPAAAAGLDNAQWVAMDYGTVMVHIFLPEMREFYALESLWEDAEIKEIPNQD